jgi:hypothetical protein
MEDRTGISSSTNYPQGQPLVPPRDETSRSKPPILESVTDHSEREHEVQVRGVSAAKLAATIRRDFKNAICTSVDL